MFFGHGGRLLGEPGWWPIVNGIIPLILWLGLIGLVVWAVMRFTRSGSGTPRHDVALEELRRRYARGDLTREEFIQRSRDLGSPLLDSGGPATPPAG